MNDWSTTPVALSQAKMLARGYCVPFIGSATVVNRPAATILSPTWTILVTSPSRTQGVFLLGTSLGIRTVGSIGAAAAAGATAGAAAFAAGARLTGTATATASARAERRRRRTTSPGGEVER